MGGFLDPVYSGKALYKSMRGSKSTMPASQLQTELIPQCYHTSHQTSLASHAKIDGKNNCVHLDVQLTAPPRDKKSEAQASKANQRRQAASPLVASEQALEHDS